MAILLVLIPLSLLLVGVAIWAFVWAVRRGQFEDLDTAPLDILRNDASPPSLRGVDGDSAGDGKRGNDAG